MVAGACLRGALLDVVVAIRLAHVNGQYCSIGVGVQKIAGGVFWEIGMLTRLLKWSQTNNFLSFYSRMKKYFLAALLLCTSVVASAQNFTEVEKAAIYSRLSYSESVCRRQVDEILKRQPIQSAPIARWLAEAMNSNRFCSCTVATVKDRLTPALLSEGADQIGSRLFMESGTACTIKQLQVTWPRFCEEMVVSAAGVAPNHEVLGEIATDVCSCVQADINELSTSTFQAFVVATVQEYKKYQRDGAPLQFERPSLVASMHRCGFPEIRAKLGLK